MSDMGRREVIAVLGGAAAAWPLRARATFIADGLGAQIGRRGAGPLSKAAFAEGLDKSVNAFVRFHSGFFPWSEGRRHLPGPIGRRITATAATDQTRAKYNPPAIEISITMCSASLTVSMRIFGPGMRAWAAET